MGAKAAFDASRRVLEDIGVWSLGLWQQRYLQLEIVNRQACCGEQRRAAPPRSAEHKPEGGEERAV